MYKYFGRSCSLFVCLPRTRFSIPLTPWVQPNSLLSQSSKSDAAGLDITPRAIKQLHKIYKRDGNPNQALRVQVDMGGCHGFQYKLELVPSVSKDPQNDILIEREGAKVLIDTISLDLIRHAKVDFSDELIAQCFQLIDIPKATTHCGCGTSFELKP